MTALRRALSPWVVAAVGTAILVSVPIAAVLSSLLRPSIAVWTHLWRTQLVELLANTTMLLIGVGAGSLVVGTVLPWLRVASRFGGRATVVWALMLPLALH